MMLTLAFIGFGTVGQGTAAILHEKAAYLKQTYGFEARIVAVSDKLKGAVYHPDGLALDALLSAAASGSLDAYPDAPGLTRGLDSVRTIRETNAQVIIEVSYTDLRTGEPALTHCRAAFAAGKSVILTNKGPVALAYQELSKAAAAKDLYFGFEGTVMSGTPSLRLAREALAGCRITAARGILNGTTNFILTQMEQGQPYAAALAEAQRLGYAEANPSGDVDGHDAAGKLAILANVVFGASLRPEQVHTTGISAITPADIKAAQAAGERWKLIASATVQGIGDTATITAQVQPERLPVSDALAGVGGVTNAITYETDLLGPVTLVGPGAGRAQTGFAILSDLLELHRTRRG
jgi:homoserine dehydrogenase